MELINKQYKILRNIKQDRKTSIYVVQDIVNNKKQKLTIINSDYLSKNLINFLINNFIELSNIDTENIVKVFNFGLISSIDNKDITYKQYFYTSEYLENYYKIQDLVENLSYKEIIDIYVQLIKAINYVNLRGIKYEQINFKNSFLHKKDDKYIFKLKDLVSIKSKKFYLKNQIDEEAIFKAPEVLNGEETSTKSEIYSLGIYLYSLLLLKRDRDIDLTKDIYSIIHANKEILVPDKNDLFNINLKKILNKMISISPDDRYEHINEIVQGINKLLNKKYKLYNYNEIEKLNFNTQLVDREYELKRIICEYKSMKNNKSQNKFIFIHGETGIGKTKLLKEVERIAKLEGNTVYSSFPNANNQKIKYFIDIVKQIIPTCEKEISELYKSELVKFIPEIDQEGEVVSSEPLASFNEKMRIFKLSESFMKEVFEDRTGMIIIDNINTFTKFSLELLQYIYNSKIIKNLIIITSYNEEDLLDNTFLEFINKMNQNKNTVSISLSGLSFEGTAILIEKILGLENYPIKFSKIIYLKTYGNPLFVEETIKNFLLNKVIYIDEYTGKWETNYRENYESLPIPQSIEQACKNEMKKISSESYFILEFIAIFNDGVSQKIIEKFMKKDGLNYTEIINDLICKGIVCKKTEDSGFIYDFCSKILKDLVYNKINEKIEIHREVVELLIKYGDNTIENRNQIIYHLEKSNQNIRAVSYYVENSNKMLILKNHREALVNLKRAIRLLPERYNEEKLRLLLQMSDIYMELFNFNCASNILKKAEKILDEVNNVYYEIDIFNRVSNIYINKNKLDIALTKLQHVENLLRDCSYKKGFIDSKIILANIYYKKMKYEKVIDICIEGINQCDKDYIKQRAVLYSILGKSNMYLKCIDEAVQDYGRVYLDSKKINYEKGIILAYSNLATIYENYYENSDIAEEYLIEVNEICKKNKFLYYEVIILQKLAEIYLGRLEYEKSLNIFKDALEKSKDIEYKNGIFNSISFIAIVQLKLNNYKEAFKYYSIAKKYIENNKTNLKNIYSDCLVEGEFSLYLGYIEETKKHAKRALQIYDEENSLLKRRIKEAMFFIKLMQEYKNIDIKRCIYKINEISYKYKNHLNKLSFIYYSCIILYEIGYKKEATRLFKSVIKDKWSSINDRVKLKEVYFRGISAEKDEKLSFLYEALKIAKKTNSVMMECKIYIKIGDYYYQNKEFIFAAYYYLESCEIIRNILKYVSREYRMQYCNFNDFVKPFKQLQNIKSMYCNDEKNHCYEDKIEYRAYKKYTVSDYAELKELLKVNNLITLLDNKEFMKGFNRIYNNFYSIPIYRKKDIIPNLTFNSLKNLKLIIKYIASRTLATEGEIVLENESGNFVTIASLTENDIRDKNEEIFQRVKKTRKPYIVFNNQVNFDISDYPWNIHKKNALACIPVIIHQSDEYSINKPNDKVLKETSIRGYIYISSEKFMNNINKSSIKSCTKLVNLIAYIIDKYQQSISCSIDKLTGAYTRKYLEEKLNESIEFANKKQREFSIIMFDLDHFKNINDTFGHQIGDKVLHCVCNIVMNNLREIDIYGRYGGEEFIAILPEVNSYKALDIANTIREEIQSSEISGVDCKVTISAGIVTYPHEAQLKRELIEKADEALYMAKNLGRNRCEIWKKEFENKVKSTNILSGIISGNYHQDSRNVLSMIELMNIVDNDKKIEKKVYEILGHIIGITEAEYANIIAIDENNTVIENFGRKRFQEGWSCEYCCNDKIFTKVIKENQGICTMDWNEMFNYDLLAVLPEWYSIMVVPINNKKDFKLILYLAVPCKFKKFTNDELNFVTILSKLIKYIK